MSYIILPFTVMNNLTLWSWNLSQLGSLSPSSSESYATRAFGSSRPQAATHSLSSVVLPKPADIPMPDDAVATSPRVNVRGDEVAVTVPWRFYVRGSRYVSRWQVPVIT